MTANVGRGISVSRGLTFLALLVLLAGLAVAFASPARAGTLDQSQTAVSGDPYDLLSAIGGGAQSFTAGLSGELDQVDVYVRRNPACTSSNQLVAHISSGNNPFPSGPALASAVVPAESVPTSYEWVSVVFPSRAPVSAGDRYVLRLSANAAGCAPGEYPYAWRHASPTEDPYPGGTGSLCFFSCISFDYAFKTYVAPPPPPPEFTGLVTLRYSQSREMFQGGLSYSNGSCVLPGQVVRVFKMEKGPNPILGSAMINLRDRYKLEARDAKGRFYAEVDQKSIPGGTCLAARSETIKVG